MVSNINLKFFKYNMTSGGIRQT